MLIGHGGVFVTVSPNRLSKMNTICAEDGIDDKCTFKQNSIAGTDKTDDQNIIQKQTNNIRIHTSG